MPKRGKPSSSRKDFAKKKSTIGRPEYKPNSPMVKSKVLKMRDQAIADITTEISEALRGVVLPSEKSRSNCLKTLTKYIRQQESVPAILVTRMIGLCFPFVTDLSPVVRDAADKFVLGYVEGFSSKTTKLVRKYSDLLFTQLELGLVHSWASIRVEILQLIDKIIGRGIGVLYNKEIQLAEALEKFSENSLRTVTDFTLKETAQRMAKKLRESYDKRKQDEFERNKVKTVNVTFKQGEWCGVVFDNTSFSRAFVNEWI
ncbi:hypothetical protein EIN_403520 [Entamoeba invadens IP1]|uniref:Pre-rRNA-processing protein Ipi1 N-terminal domain-containing protein n=1 Tax=Entamoeba invadens IP1 TaxID=370355 RepID=A0A0A1U6H4_ENTIV|nr:hypothetical protein EIN_403520 [Entamoeba invadens IP1]ELP90018.1 hypothetical protein EIN_403520 [Entamoeba invadens IP1]|eukprot:XP_004256789.1 hypothetical protein EIN_403520 [Entamoeba invadens IP1]